MGARGCWYVTRTQVSLCTDMAINSIRLQKNSSYGITIAWAISVCMPDSYYWFSVESGISTENCEPPNIHSWWELFWHYIHVAVYLFGTIISLYSRFTPWKPRSPLILNGEVFVAWTEYSKMRTCCQVSLHPRSKEKPYVSSILWYRTWNCTVDRLELSVLSQS